MAHATAADVKSRLPGRTIDSSSSPAESDVTQWILEADSIIDNSLASGGVTAPTTGAGNEVLKSISADYAEGRVRMAYAATGGDGDNDDGKDLVERFWSTIQDMRRYPTAWGAIVGGGTAPAGSRQLRGYVLNNADSKTIADGDFSPSFERDEKF